MANTQNKEKKIKKINEKHKCDIKSNSLKLENNKCFVATILGYFINFLHEVVNGSFCHNRGEFIEVSRCLSSSVWVSAQPKVEFVGVKSLYSSPYILVWNN